LTVLNPSSEYGSSSEGRAHLAPQISLQVHPGGHHGTAQQYSVDH
jgi:hypothetical protein